MPANLPPDFDVQGHRGARGLKPENTLPAFETALDLGVTTLELDLHFTNDGRIVIWHDPEIDAAKCGLDPAAAVAAPNPDSLIKLGDDLMISQLTLAQVQAYRCDRNPEPERFPAQDNAPTALAGADYRIITLAELFDFVQTYSQSEAKTPEQRANAAQVLFNIETKRKPNQPNAIGDDFDGENPGAFERAILETIADAGVYGRVTIQSFDHRSLWAIRRVDADIPLAALTSRTVPDLADLAARGATIWSPRFNDVTSDLLTQAQAAGLAVVPWTVNDPADMQRLIDMGVDGIITDRPDLLLNLE